MAIFQSSLPLKMGAIHKTAYLVALDRATLRSVLARLEKRWIPTTIK
jgi:hypothetical protein